MQLRRQRAVIGLLLIPIYVILLRALPSLMSTDHGPAWAQGYPNPSPSPTSAGYPGPAPTDTIPPTASETPTVTVVPGSPEPTSIETQTAAPTAPLDETPSATATETEATSQPTQTVPPIALPPTRPVASPTSQEATEEPATPSPTPLATTTATATVTVTLAPGTLSASEASRPDADLLPPVADRRWEPSIALSLLAGALLAGLAWRVWRRWFAPAVSNSPDDDETNVLNK